MLLLGGSFRLFLCLAALLLFFSVPALFVLHPLLTGLGLLAALLLLLGVATLLFLNLTLTGFGFGLTALHFRGFALLLLGAGGKLGLAVLLLYGGALLFEGFALTGLLLGFGFAFGDAALLFGGGAPRCGEVVLVLGFLLLTAEGGLFVHALAGRLGGAVRLFDGGIAGEVF